MYVPHGMPIHLATHLATTEATHKLQLVSLSSKEDYDAIYSQQLALCD